VRLRGRCCPNGGTAARFRLQRKDQCLVPSERSGSAAFAACGSNPGSRVRRLGRSRILTKNGHNGCLGQKPTRVWASDPGGNAATLPPCADKVFEKIAPPMIATEAWVFNAIGGTSAVWKSLLGRPPAEMLLQFAASFEHLFDLLPIRSGPTPRPDTTAGIGLSGTRTRRRAGVARRTDRCRGSCSRTGRYIFFARSRSLNKKLTCRGLTYQELTRRAWRWAAPSIGRDQAGNLIR
jgi:hypothetical protein